MNCTLLSKTTGLDLDSLDVHSDKLRCVTDEGHYATAPMAIISVVDDWHDEEALHTSFEQAISGRVSAIQGRLSRLESGTSHSVASRFNTDPMLPAATSQVNDRQAIITGPLTMDPASAISGRVSLLDSLRLRYTLLVAMVLTSGLLGFDLMGLLILHMR